MKEKSLEIKVWKFEDKLLKTKKEKFFATYYKKLQCQEVFHVCEEIDELIFFF